MPVIPTFDPGSEGASAVINNTLTAAAGWQNIFARAQAMRQSAQAFEMEKQKFAADMATSNLRQQLLTNQLSEQRLKLNEDEAIAKINGDLRTAKASRLQQGAAAISEAMKQLDGVDDPTAVEIIHGQVMSRFADLESDPRFQQIAAPFVDRVTAAKGGLMRVSMAASEGMLPQLYAVSTPEELAAIKQSPYFRYAMRSPEFASVYTQAQQHFQKIEAEKAKAQIDFSTKAALEGVKAGYQREVNQPKAEQKAAELTAPGWDGQARTREEAVKFRETAANTEQVVQALDNAIEIARKYQAATDPAEKVKYYQLAQQTADMVVGKLRLPLTGPGAFTDSERAFVKDTIGNPAKIFALSANEYAKIENMKKSLEEGLLIDAKSKGYAGRTPQPKTSGGTDFKEGDNVTAAGPDGQPVSGQYRVINGRKALVAGTTIYWLQ